MKGSILNIFKCMYNLLLTALMSSNEVINNKHPNYECVCKF